MVGSQVPCFVTRIINCLILRYNVTSIHPDCEILCIYDIIKFTNFTYNAVFLTV